MTNTRSVLSQNLHAALIAVGAKLEQQHDVGSDVVGIIEGLNKLSPSVLAQAEREIVEGANLHYRADRRRKVRIGAWEWFWPNRTYEVQLRKVAGLEYLSLFHRDGRIREAALRKIAGPIPSPFLFVAIAWRMNDWVREVRDQAAKCCKRTFALTSSDIVAEAAMVLLVRDDSWKRWTSERLILAEAFARPDVTAKLAELLATRSTGPSATILRYALRSAAMDPHLPQLANEAIQPAVRAIARQALIDGFTSWPNGWRWRWVDKSMGVRRRETAFEKRPLSVSTDRLSQIEAGLRDSSPAVRNAAISGLIRYRDEVAEPKRLAEQYRADSSRRVRERAEFIVQSC
jgi:hypothetical protein